MIEACEGSLGAGKTYYCTDRISQHLSRGGMVFTNVEVKWDKWEGGEGMRHLVMSKYRKVPVPEQLVLLEKKTITDFQNHLLWGTDEINVLCVLDELHLWFDQYTGKEFNKKLMEFLTQSRKCNVDIIFISQDILNVAVQFRRLIQYVWFFRDMATYTLPLWGVIDKWHILGICLDRNKKSVMKRVWMRKDKRVFGAYKSKAIVSDMDIPDKRASVFHLEDVPAPSVWEVIRFNKRDAIILAWIISLALVLALKFTMGIYV